MRTVLVTGASGGIGAAVAAAFAACGDTVIVNYRSRSARAEEVAELCRERGGSAEAFRADVSKSEEVNAMVREIERKYRGIDVLVNNAGIQEFRLVTDATDEEYRRMTDTNFGSVFFATRAVLPRMIERKSGVIVNVSSIWGKVGASCECLYSAAKAAVIGFTKAVAKEAGPSGVRVNCVCPGVIDTEMNAGHSAETMKELAENTALSRLGRPEDVAAVCVFLAGDGAAYLTGQAVTVDGGYL